MTREEAINAFKEWIERDKKIEYADRLENIEIYKLAIKALETENVLDKIRAEIESQRKEVSKKHPEDEISLNYYFGLNDGLKDARDIIDEYSAESEE